MSVSYMNPSWTRIHIQTSFYMVHTVNLLWPAQNLVRIGLHGSLTDEYTTRWTQTLTQPGEAPQAVRSMGYATPCMSHVPRGARPKVVTSGPHFGRIREREREGGG